MKRFLIVIALLTIGQTLSSAAAASDAISVFVSIPPQEYFVRQIGGDRVSINVLVSPDANPHAFEPSPKQMVGLARAGIYFTAGIPFEAAWLDKIRSATPGLKIVSMADGIERKPIDRHTVEGDHGGHDHNALDPHIWLSPPLVMLQARNILSGLIEVDPGGRQAYERNYAAFIKELVALDAQLRDRLKRGDEFMVFHPSWGYFADAYGMKQIAIETEGKSPKAAEIARLIKLAEKRGIRTVLVQPQFSTRDADMISEAIRGKTVAADPLAENWAGNLLRVADRIRGE